jgi:hypothetical protein
MFLEGPASLRACSSILGGLLDCLTQFRARPAPNTIQSWLLRLGLHEIQRPKEQADDWILIVDHTIQLGTLKCLLIVAIRQSAWDKLETPLSLRDIVVVTLQVVKKSNGDVVAQQLREAAQKLGKVRAILSDQGSDIVNGANQYQAQSKETLIFKDIAHATAIVLKDELLADSRWDNFVKECGRTQPKVKQTELGYLAPPTLKIKGRYMNLGPLIAWASRMLCLLDKPLAQLTPDMHLTCLKEKFGWLVEYRQDIAHWHHLHAIKDCVLEYCRLHGYHCQAKAELELLLASVSTVSSCTTMKERLLDIVQQQSSQLKENESVPASSEVIESLIGKGKRIQGQHSRGGFTKMILGMAACVVPLDEDRIRQSLNAVGDSDLFQWCQTQFGKTLACLRRQALPIPTEPI